MHQINSMRKIGRLLVIIAALALGLACPVNAQEAEWEKLMSEAQTLYLQGRYGEAESTYKQALRFAETFGDSDHPTVAASLFNLAGLYRTQGQYPQAEPLYKRSLSIAEKALGPDHPVVAKALNGLALLYDMQGQHTKAEPLFRRSLAIQEKALGADHLDVATGLNNIAELYRIQGKYEQAEPLYKRSLAIYEQAFGPDHPDVALSLNNLAGLYVNQGQYAQAEQLYKRSLAIKEKALSPDHLDIATGLNNIAELYRIQGQYEQAESLYKRSLTIGEKVLSADHSEVAKSINNLAGLYVNQGQYARAEPLLKRSLAIQEKALGPDHPDVATGLNNIAELYRIQGQYEQAEPHYRRSLTIFEKALGSDHPNVAQSVNNLATLYVDQGLYSQAELFVKRALVIREQALGPDHPDVAQSLNNLAELYRIQDQYEQAEPLYKRSLTIFEKALGSDHPDVALSVNNLAVLYVDQGRDRQALSMSRKASSIYRQRIVAGETGEAAIQEASKNRLGFLRHLELLSKNPDKEATEKIVDEAFQIVQLEQASGTASAIAKMAVRFASGDDALAGIIRRKQDASDRRTRREAQLVAAVSKPPQERKAGEEQGLRDDIAIAGKELESIDAELTHRFPEYRELTRPEPATVSQVRTLLKQGEAMLVYSLGERSFLWVVKADGAVFVPILATAKDMAVIVAKIRSEMEFNASGESAPVSVYLLHELYQRIFAPALPYFDGIKHVMVVPSGTLQSLPFGMLVASPSPAITSDSDYRKVDWLARQYAFSVLPSVRSIQAFRQIAKKGASQDPFAGFGDPLIGGLDSMTRGKRGKVDVAAVFRNVAPKIKAQPGTRASEIADVKAIRSAPRLPETADELRAMAKALKSDQKSLWLQENATETRIKFLDLSKYQTLAFATHGVMAGEIKGVGEPGLILTPPLQGSIEDDGYLSASEVAKLKLNADWVVLSACNTAAADGTPGAEGLSGLAKAFFYAGARSLLVSHWPVASEATVPLTTGMLKEYEVNPSQGKAEAHRKSMMALMASPDHPEYAHPVFWAPFVVVGEGGADRN